MFRNRALRASVAMIAVAMLGACAQHKVARADPGHQPVAAARGPHGYRFNMTQHGKKMSAEDFDAWMKANGLHVAKGPDAKAKAKTKSKSTAKAKPKAEPKAEPGKKVAAATVTEKKPSRD
jgi:hypothetical protein